MAQIEYRTFGWVGHGFNPGVEHGWSMWPIPFASVVNVTAHAVRRLDREIMVKDIRIHVNVDGNQDVRFTVRNTGANNIPGYNLAFSIVTN